LKTIGAVQWLLGLRQEAIQTFRASVDGILNRTIKFADLAGGVSQGVLLWYTGGSAPDASAREYALKYLTKLAKRSRIEYWPGPLARLVLDQVDFAFVLEKATGMRELQPSVDLTKGDLLKRRQLVQALFYRGVQARSLGHESECQDWMRRCFELENPIIELEWYLARNEVRNALPDPCN
jgi:hypothetical protein